MIAKISRRSANFFQSFSEILPTGTLVDRLRGHWQSWKLLAQLVGTWRFVSASQRMVDGTVRPDPQTGLNGKGYITYTDTGKICALIANPDRPKWKSEAAPQEEELRSAFAGLVAYCGTYEVNETEKYVVHHIEMDTVPNRAGTDRKRYISLSGNRLILLPEDLPEGVQAWEVVWERVEK